VPNIELSSCYFPNFFKALHLQRNKPHRIALQTSSHQGRNVRYELAFILPTNETNAQLNNICLSTAKHFINDPTHLIQSALQAVTQTNPTTALDAENKVVYLRPDAAKPQVSLVSGGGAGHEPSFAAFVGPGLLSGAVAGTIFASPSAEQIRRCILQRVEKSKGVLVVVMNYTGDVLNFGMAVEKARAAGIEAHQVVVADDCGVGRERGGKVGRRGIAGTVLVQKIAGALAASGASLQEVHTVAKAVADNVVSIGSSLSHVHVPGRAPGGEDELKDNEIEVGMGMLMLSYRRLHATNSSIQAFTTNPVQSVRPVSYLARSRPCSATCLIHPTKTALS